MKLHRSHQDLLFIHDADIPSSSITHKDASLPASNTLTTGYATDLAESSAGMSRFIFDMNRFLLFFLIEDIHIMMCAAS